MVKVSQCMRRHGVSGFPDPTTSIPSIPPAGGGVISDRDGVIFVFPATLDVQSPLFEQAAAACGFQLTNHRSEPGRTNLVDFFPSGNIAELSRRRQSSLRMCGIWSERAAAFRAA